MSLVVGDFNSDGRDDFAVNEINANFRFYLNDGDGTSFSLAWTSSNLGTAYYNQVVDFDSDGDLDLIACAFTSGTLTFFENAGNATFTERQSLVDPSTFSAEPNYGYGLAVGDFDGNGLLDIAFGKDPVIIIYDALGSFFAGPA